MLEEQRAKNSALGSAKSQPRSWPWGARLRRIALNVGKMAYMRNPAVPANTRLDLQARLEFGDSGVGGWPAGGLLAIVESDREQSVVLTSRLSNTALREAEAIWAARADPAGLSSPESVEALRRAVEVDAAYAGYNIDWRTACYTPGDLRIDLTAAVTPARDPSRSENTSYTARLDLELVDGRANHASWRVTDHEGGLVADDTFDLLDGQPLDIAALARHADSLWQQHATEHDWVQTSDLESLDHLSTWATGTCGTISISGSVR